MLNTRTKTGGRGEQGSPGPAPCSLVAVSRTSTSTDSKFGIFHNLLFESELQIIVIGCHVISSYFTIFLTPKIEQMQTLPKLRNS